MFQLNYIIFDIIFIVLTFCTYAKQKTEKTNVAMFAKKLISYCINHNGNNSIITTIIVL